MRSAVRRRSLVLLVLAASLWCPWPPAATLAQDAPADEAAKPLFSDGFESTSDLSLWSMSEGLEVQQREVISGGFAARGTNTGDEGPRFAVKKLDHEQEDLYVRVRFNLISQGGTPVNLFRLRTARGDAIISIFVNPDGRLGYVNNVTGDTVESDVMVDRGQWHELQLHASAIPGHGQTEVWLDEDPVAGLTGRAGLGTVPIGRVELGDNTGAHTYDLAFDDVVVQTSFIPSSQMPEAVSGFLAVQTLPPVPGATFIVDGRAFTTDAEGFVRIEIARWSPNLKERLEIPDVSLPDGSRARFARWFGWSEVLNDDVTAAFFVDFPIAYSFIDLQGNPIDASQITSLTFKSSTGVSHTFTPDDHGDQLLLQGSRVVPTQAGPLNKHLYYTLENAIVSGSNVVNRAQQRYHPATESAWVIQLRYFFVDFSSRDAFFGFPIGSAVKLVYPDGEVAQEPFGQSASVRLGPLPRGDYQVSAVGPGFSPPGPLTLTRDQVVDMKIITYLDMAFAALVMLSIGFGLLFIGRPQLILVPARLVRHPSQLLRLARQANWRPTRWTSS